MELFECWHGWIDHELVDEWRFVYKNTFSNSVILLAPKTLWTLANLWGLVGGKYGAKTQS